MAENDTDTHKTAERVVIKKYANRRLYNTSTSAYVTLDNLAAMVREGVDFVVFDAKSGDDITRSVLAQIIFEEESKGASLLPIQFLRQLIGFYGDSMQSILPSYLEMSLDNFTRQQEQFRAQFGKTFGVAPAPGMPGAGMFDEQVRQNLAMFERAMKMFSPFAYPPAGAAGDKAEPAAPPTADAPPANPLLDAQAQALEQMKKQMQEMQAQLARLSGLGPKP